MLDREYITGTFVREEKNRFLCTVNVNGIDEECYIPSSCKLENFLKLAGKEVILHENMNKSARTRLAVYAIRYKRNYLILRTSEANDIVYKSISSRRFAYLGKRDIVEKERKVNEYKADLYIPQTNTVIEIKSIISTNDDAVFPTVYSERALEQFRKIKGLLQQGYKVVYIYISLNPYVKQVTLSKDIHLIEYTKLFNECIALGMKCKAYTSEMNCGKSKIKKEIEINYEI